MVRQIARALQIAVYDHCCEQANRFCLYTTRKARIGMRAINCIHVKCFVYVLIILQSRSITKDIFTNNVVC